MLCRIRINGCRGISLALSCLSPCKRLAVLDCSTNKLQPSVEEVAVQEVEEAAAAGLSGRGSCAAAAVNKLSPQLKRECSSCRTQLKWELHQLQNTVVTPSFFTPLFPPPFLPHS